MELFLFWFIFALIVGVAASHGGWFVLSVLISPLFAIILVRVAEPGLTCSPF